MLIGRHSDADVRLPLADVSRRHCRFVFRKGCWSIYDLQSLNGVFLNEERIEQAAVHEGDQIRIGRYTFEVHLDPTVLAFPSSNDAARRSQNSTGGLANPTSMPHRQAS